MGYQIIKQPDGLLAIRSTHTDTIVAWDASRQDVLEWFAELEVERARQAAIVAREAAIRNADLVLADRPREAYHQWALTWEEALESDREHDGECSREQTGTANGA